MVSEVLSVCTLFTYITSPYAMKIFSKKICGTKAKIAPDKLKQARNTLFRVITVGERHQNKFELSFTDTQWVEFFMGWMK